MNVLSPRQREIYANMKPDTWYAAKELNTSVALLNDMRRMKLVDRVLTNDIEGQLSLDPGKFVRYRRRG